MSQSETWDRLLEAADWRDGGPPQQTMAERIIDAARGGVRPEPSPAPEMPEPEAKWVRRTNYVRCPRFYEASEWDVDEDDRTPRGVQIAMARRQIESRNWLAWTAWRSSHHFLSVDLGRDAANFHVGMQVVLGAPGQSATDAVIDAIDAERGRVTLGRSDRAFVNSTTYEQLLANLTPRQHAIVERRIMERRSGKSSIMEREVERRRHEGHRVMVVGPNGHRVLEPHPPNEFTARYPLSILRAGQPYPQPSIPRRNLTAALVALPDYRGPVRPT